AHPWTAVAGSPVGELRLRIVGARDPHRCTAGLPLIAARPRLASGFAGRGNRVGLPRFLAGFDVERRDETTNADFAAGDTDHHEALGHERRARDVVALLVVVHLRRPAFLTGLRVDRNEDGIAGAEEHRVLIERDTAARPMERDEILGQRTL